jgi:DNA-binding GntR family transcriptional regulator
LYLLVTMLRTTTLAARAYAELKKRLLMGEWHPKQRLIEEELCELLGMSRTPLRSALARLEHDGLLVARNRRGYEVVAPDARTLADLHALRETLEIRAAELAAGRRTRSDLTALDALLGQLLRLQGKGKWEEEVRVGIDVHRLVARASGDRFLSDTLNRLYDRLALAVWVDPSVAADLTAARGEHRAIVHALRAGDAARVRRVVRRHSRRSKRLAVVAARARRAGAL